MTTARFQSNQDLNEWVAFLHDLFGPTQNYPKTSYEIHAHLTEVCGVFGKLLFKKHDVEAATTFLPKMFAWAVALLKAVHPDETDLEGIVLRKFPGVCPYCGSAPCECWKTEKPTLDPNRVRMDYYRNAPSLRRSPNDFQLMFKKIYMTSWAPGGHPNGAATSGDVQLRTSYVRMIEELAEMAEAIRFYHLYPQNFENELADYFAWWFALVSCLPDKAGDTRLLAEDVLWRAYPGRCPYCDLFPCFCRPGPVRELMSKPPPGQDHRFDALTALYNQGAYKEDVGAITAGLSPAAVPASCARVDVDDFKSVNDTYGHAAGDAALKHIATVLRTKARERDRVYRIGGDEFGALLMDTTEEEAKGMMKRVCADLVAKPVRWVDAHGRAAEFHVSVSVGVAEFSVPGQIEKGFEQADQASYASKHGGKARVTAFSELDGSTA